MNIYVPNVSLGLLAGLVSIRKYGVHRETRNGPVLRLPEPLMVTYSHPEQRVLFYPGRRPNPYFHFLEALWMLSGDNRVELLSHIVPRMMEYSDDGRTLHGAYGHRWRRFYGWDQIIVIKNMLRNDPTTRRAVLTMWAPSSDLDADSKDLPCNTHAYFEVDEGRLNMTVCNRSNDIVWGMFGANAVHFSFLQEVMAAQVGVGVGTYTQFSNNAHLYLNMGQGQELLGKIPENLNNPYVEYKLTPYPVVAEPDDWFHDLKKFMQLEDGCHNDFVNPFFPKVAKPLYLSWLHHYEGDQETAKTYASQIEDLAWRMACLTYLK